MSDLVKTLIHDLGSRPAARQYALKVAHANGEDSEAYATAADEICKKCSGAGTHCPECRIYGHYMHICDPSVPCDCDPNVRGLDQATVEEQCECHEWATLNVRHMILTGHHENCSKRVIKPEKALMDLVKDLVDGMNAWGQDCDGIHPDAWEAYVRANAILLQPLKHDVVD